MYGRSRTNSSAKSNAAWAAPRWFEAKPSVNVRGSSRTQAPGAPNTISGSTR